MQKAPYEGRTALVTGGSGGIGFELARLFARDGARLVLVAARKEKLEAAASEIAKESGRRPFILAKDLGLPESPGEIFEELSREGVRVDALANNAGFGLYGKFSSHDLGKTLKMVDVNVKAPVALTRLFLPGMLQRGYGRILNVSSTAAFQAIPVESVYAASKSFLLLFSEAIAEELAGTGIRVTCLCPGPTRTGFFNGEMLPSKTVTRNMMDSREVARIGYEALCRGRAVVVAGFLNRAATALERFLPRKTVVRLAGRVVK